MNEERVQILQGFLNEDPADSFSRFALALEYLKAGDPETTRFHFEYIRDNDPEYTGVYYHLGKLYQQTENYEKAVETFNTGIDIAGKNGDTHAANELKEALLQLEEELS